MQSPRDLQRGTPRKPRAPSEDGKAETQSEMALTKLIEESSLENEEAGYTVGAFSEFITLALVMGIFELDRWLVG
jgi:hypothetical protein